MSDIPLLNHPPRETVEGRLWVLRNAKEEMIDNIDTDMIFHNAHLAITDIEKMGSHAFGNLEGYKNFNQQAQPGDIILAGRNFGAGSSRQQAVDCFLSLGISLLLAESFGAIYKRNAINAAFPIMEAQGLTELKNVEGNFLLNPGDRIQVNLRTGLVTHLESNQCFQSKPMSQVQLDIFYAGGLFAYGRMRQGIGAAPY